MTGDYKDGFKGGFICGAWLVIIAVALAMLCGCSQDPPPIKYREPERPYVQVAALQDIQETQWFFGPGSYGPGWGWVYRPNGVVRHTTGVPVSSVGGWSQLDPTFNPVGKPCIKETYTNGKVNARLTLSSFDGPLPCLPHDSDGDGDVDLYDFAEFQKLMGGP